MRTEIEQREIPSWMVGAAHAPNISGAAGTLTTTGTMTTSVPRPFAPGKIIAMHGDPGSGKDTVGEYLVKQYGFTRLAFADKLKVMCEALDPIVDVKVSCQDRVVEGESPSTHYTETLFMRLVEVVSRLGWDEAKKAYPEVRRTQQRLATEVIRDHVDPDFWVKVVENQFLVGGNYVITDLRFPNEYEMVKRHGGVIWWITRPDNPYGGLGENAKHISEFWHPPMYCSVVNGYDIDELHAKIDVAMTGGGFAHYEILGD